MTDEQRGGVPSRETWPELPFDAWQDTYDTLQLWTQIVGKVRLAKAPMITIGGRCRFMSPAGD